MTKQGESALSKKIKDWLTSQGFRAWKVWQGAYSEAGVADLHAIRNGHYIAIETKLPGEEPTALQEKFLKEINDQGGFGCVAWSLSDVKLLVERLTSSTLKPDYITWTGKYWAVASSIPVKKKRKATA